MARRAETVAATGIEPPRVRRCRRVATPEDTLAATDEDHRLVRNWICTSRSCAVRPTVAGTAAIAARQITAGLGPATVEAPVARPATVEVVMPRAEAEGGTLAAVAAATRAEVVAIRAVGAEGTRAEVVTGKTKNDSELM